MGQDLIGLGTEPLPRSGVLFPKQAVTASHTEEASLQQSGVDDLVVVIDFTKVGASPSVVFKIQGVMYPAGDYEGPNSGTAVTWDILTSAAIIATGVVVLKVSDSMLAVTNLVANDIVPDRIRVVCTHTNGDGTTYSISLVLAP